MISCRAELTSLEETIGSFLRGFRQRDYCYSPEWYSLGKIGSTLFTASLLGVWVQGWGKGRPEKPEEARLNDGRST